MRIISFIAYAAIIFGVAGIFAGDRFGMAKALHLSIFLIGAGLALGGLASLVTRRMSMIFSSSEAQGYDGFPALVWGLMLFLLGAAVIGYAYALDAHSWGRVQTMILRYPGGIAAVAGMFLMGDSVLLFVNDGSNRPWWSTLLFRVPRILVALVALVCGFVVAAGGAWYTADAKGFAKFERQVSTRAELALRDSPLLEPVKRARWAIAARFAG